MQLTQIYLAERHKVPGVFLCGNTRALPITWKSKKLEIETKSPMLSETMALAESADTGHFVTLMTK